MTEAGLVRQELHELSPVMETALGVKQKKRNIGIFRCFFMNENIQSPDMIDCYVRDRFLRYLDQQDISARTRENYIRQFDKLVMDSIPVVTALSDYSPEQRFFRPDRIFLLYLPDVSKAATFKRVVDKNDLIMDFSGIAVSKVKKQLKQILCGILSMDQKQGYRRTYLKPFQRFIEFVREQKIEDITQLELSDEKRFFLYLNKENDWIRENAGKFIRFSRRVLFMSSPSIDWNANVWFLDKFIFDKSRINESCPIDSLSFLEVANRHNRKRIKEYARYLLGITDMAISTCRNWLSSVSKLLQYLDRLGLDIEEINEDVIISYIEFLSETAVKYSTINKDLMRLESFLRYTKVKCNTDINIGSLKRYQKKGYQQHNDRSVPITTICSILENIDEFPEPIGLMYLILYCTGIRKSEICLLKGGSFYQDHGEHWLQVFQQKAQFSKVIPIPEELYHEVMKYIGEKDVRKEEYLFKNANGEAFNACTFSAKMIDECTARGISCGDYIFRAHDYRHTMATMLRDNGVTIQAAREYMGHQSEEMTKQYFDNMQKRILEKQKQYLIEKGGVVNV